MDMANILASVDAIKTARLNRTIGETALADRDERKRLEAEERARAIADEGALRGARTEAWNSGGQNVGGLVGLDPQGAAAILGHFQSLAAAGKTEQIQTAKDNAETMGRLFAWVKTSPDPASAYAQARQNLPAAMQRDVPEAYDPGYVDMALARTMSVADIMEQATAAKAEKAFTEGMGALAQPQSAPAAPAPTGSPMPEMSPGAPPVGPQQPNSGPSQQAAYAHARLVKSGLSPAAASGVVGNLMQESGSNLNPSSWNPQEGALGIAQWREDRRVKLVNFAEAHGTDPRDFDTQLDFIVHELDTSEKAAGDRLRQATTPQEAAAIFDKLYERSSGAHIDKRVQNAAMLHSALGGKEYADAGAMPGPASGPAAPQGGLDPRIVALMQAAGQQQDAGRREILTKAIDILQEQSQGIEPQNRYRNVGDNLVDLTAPGGPQPVEMKLPPPRVDPSKMADIEGTLRDDWRADTPEWRDVENNFQNVANAFRDQSGAADYQLLVSFAKVLDPGSVAREGEVAAIQSAAAQIPGLWQKAQNVLAGNGTLEGTLRSEIYRLTATKYQQMRGQVEKNAERFRGIATGYGANPDNAVGPIPDYLTGAPPVPAPAFPGQQGNGQGPAGGVVRPRASNAQGQMIEYDGVQWVPVQQ
jgi:hypothetical protein